ncbi:MAG: c-type cytochrome domain-containing protein, partial [Planctomycetaceae bacterium]
MSIVSRCAIVILVVLIQPVTAQTKTDFELEVAPILLSRCLECHQTVNPSGGLSLQTETSQRQGGDSGPALLPGNAAGSLMMMRITAAEMPPPANGHERPLPASEVAVLKRWIDEGAAVPTGRVLDLFEKTLTSRGGRDWWSLQPLQTHQPPDPSSVPWNEWQQHPVDRFLAASLQRQQLTPAPRATPRELVRRLSWVLTGLPPQTTDLNLAIATEKAGQGSLTTV